MARFDADVVESCIPNVREPRWGEWAFAQARTPVMYADKGMFPDAQKDEFVRYRPGTLHIDLADASLEAHLDQVHEWIDVLRDFPTTSL